jgi:hypothetical protein
LIATAAALITSAWAMLVAPSRALQALGFASFLTASITVVLWWRAMTEILRTT